MRSKIIAFLAIAVYQVTAQCCGPRPTQVQPPVINQFVPNVVTNLPAPNVVSNLPVPNQILTNLPVPNQVLTNLPVPSQVLTNLPTPVIKNQIVTGYNGYNQIVPNCINPVVPNAVFATTLVDNSVANSLANALQLLIVSDLIESTLNAKDCPTVVESIDVRQEYSYPQLVATDLSYSSNPCNGFNQVEFYPDVVTPLTAQLTFGYNSLPVVSLNVDGGCGCNGFCGCPATKFYL